MIQTKGKIKICYKCLKVQPENIVNRKNKGKWLNSKTHQCTNCGSYTFFSGSGVKNAH